MAQNKMVFREYNERIQRGFDELVYLARQEGKSELTYGDNAPLQFYCECSDEKCNDRIALTPSTYAHIHERRNRFVVKKEHSNQEIERIIHSSAQYSVIEMRAELPRHAATLQNIEADEEN